MLCLVSNGSLAYHTRMSIYSPAFAVPFLTVVPVSCRPGAQRLWRNRRCSQRFPVQALANSLMNAERSPSPAQSRGMLERGRASALTMMRMGSGREFEIFTESVRTHIPLLERRTSDHEKKKVCSFTIMITVGIILDFVVPDSALSMILLVAYFDSPCCYSAEKGVSALL